MKTAFSLDTVNTRYQEPNRNRVESKYYWEELFTLISAGGFDAIEMPYDSGFMGARCAYPFSKVVLDVKFGGVDGFKQDLAGKGISKVAGLQFTPRAAGSVEEYVKGFVFGVKGMIGHAKLLGCDYVIASVSPEIASMGALLDKKDELLDALAAELPALADEAGDIKICLRNEYWGILRGTAMQDFMKKVDSRICYCVDLANLKIAEACPFCFIKEAGNRIGCVTLTDTSFVDEYECYKDNNPQFPAKQATQVFKDLGEGSIDIKGIVALLKEIGFDGWMTVSNRQTRQVSRGILRARYTLNNI
ncbi:MAG: sugar phosphate isomerase/epimerase [Oscillospiraceae bacterium]|nr:sugar phosphate isomerase/epimerase [Oscillospiraceae bacterium]